MRVLRKWSIVFLAGLAWAQSPAPPAFEVGLVKPYIAGGRSGMSGTADSLYIGNRTLKELVQELYKLQPYQLTGAEGWMDSTAYTIMGKSSGPTSFDEQFAMARTLLADRFQLNFHWETRQLPGYWLVAGKNGPRMTPAPDDQSRGWVRDGLHLLQGHKMPLSQLTLFLGAIIRMPIEDKTGLAGQYDFKLEWSDDSQGVADSMELQKPSLFAAVQDQLGLKLELHRGPVQVLVIDSAQKPAEN